MERELTMEILEKLNNFKMATYRQVEKTHELMESTEFELHYTKSGCKGLLDRLKNAFKSIKDLFRRSFPMPGAAMSGDNLERCNLRDLCKKDEMEHKEHRLTNPELLTKIRNELADIEEHTTYTSGKFLKRMENLKTDAMKQRMSLNSMGSYAEKEFSEVKELIRKNCTTYNEDNEEEDFLASIGVTRT